MQKKLLLYLSTIILKISALGKQLKQLVSMDKAKSETRTLSQWTLNGFLKDFEGFTLLVVSPLNALIVIGLIMLIAFLAGTLPALKASRLDPITALRSE